MSEEGDKIQVQLSPQADSTPDATLEKTPIITEDPAVATRDERSVIVTPPSPTIAINIQLQIPEADDPTVYENLFRALRKHLFDSSDDAKQ